MEHAVEQGFSAIKCAPFEMVSNDGDQVSQSEYRLSVLEFLRKDFPDLSISIDFHERFHIHALGELYFGRTGFSKIVENGWADVIMPDIKHVGGFGALANVIQCFAGKTEISPHNPSGPVSTVASLHSAAISPDVTSLEVPLIVDDRRAYE